MRREIGTALGLCLLLSALPRLLVAPTARPALRARRCSWAPREAPFDLALRQAVERQHQAVNEAATHQEVLSTWDPQSGPDGDPSQSREYLLQLARDPGGYLRRARDQARQAAALARTPHEVCRAGALLAWLECGLGRHDRELCEAEKITALEPRSALSLSCLRHAARCNRLRPLEQKADAALQSLARNSRRSHE